MNYMINRKYIMLPAAPFYIFCPQYCYVYMLLRVLASIIENFCKDLSQHEGTGQY